MAPSKNMELKLIQIDELSQPCKILKTIYERSLCSSYLVAVPIPDGREDPRFLQVFPSGQEDLCRSTEETLIDVLGKGTIRHYSFQGSEYLLIQMPPCCLDWEKALKQPLSHRVELLSGLVQYLEDLQKRGYIPFGLDLSTFVQLPDGTLNNWDLRNVLGLSGAEPETLVRYRRKCSLDLARLFVQALTGRKSLNQKTLGILKLSLLGRMPVSDQQTLITLLDDYLHRDDRLDLAPLKEQLEEVKVYLELYEPEIPANRHVTLAAANFLHTHPLWQYVRDGALKILMVGSSPMRKAFLDAIISCAQMLDTQMHIQVVAEDAASFCDRYLKKAPLLAQAAQITHIPERPNRSYDLNEKITGKDRLGNAAPLAYLTFENAPFPGDQKSFDAGCILVLEPCTEEMCQSLLRTAAKQTQPLLIGLKDPVPRPEGLKVLGGMVVVDSFSPGRRSDLSKSRMYRDAFGVHTYYAKEDEQRKTSKEILASFDDPYNRDSSIRAALSIPYKLAAYGLGDCQDQSRRFQEEVLKDPHKLRRLIWLEHRSWQAFLMTRGWTLDPENLEQAFINNGYNHKCNGVWHSCLFGSNDTATEPLESWSTQDWETKSMEDLDPLDAMSVQLHRSLMLHVHEIMPEAETLLKKLDETWSNHLPASQYQQLEQAFFALRSNVTNADLAWKRARKALDQELLHTTRQHRADIQSLLTDLDGYADLILKRNARKQYKELDRAILEAIPYLLEQDSIRCIYKLWADQDQPWNNLASAFFIEPEKVYLLTTPGQASAIDQKNDFAAFLKKRKIDTKITVLPLEELTSIHEGAVLDVTGATAAQLVQVTGKLASLQASIPVIHYTDGRLQTLDGNCPLTHCYRCNQTLTVEEMMCVTGTKVHGENETLPMQRMTNANELWDAAQKISDYNALSGFLEKFIKQWKVHPDNNNQTESPWTPLHTDITHEGLKDLLNRLEKEQVIKPVAWHFPQITATDPRCQKALNRMLSAYDSASADKRDGMHLSFRSDDPDAVCVLESQSLTFRHDLAIQTEGNTKYACAGNPKENKKRKLKDLTDALDTLNDFNLIQAIGTDPLYQQITKKGTQKNENGEDVEVEEEYLQVCFQYADFPTMDCLTKAGNALEALAYHTIREMDVFDDVKLGVSILWKQVRESDLRTQNEIDLICTKGTRSYFISCKKRPKLEKEQITEIRYETDRFGVNGTPIMLTVAPEQKNKPVYVRAARMGVEMITLSDSGSQDSAGIIRKRIREILGLEP